MIIDDDLSSPKTENTLSCSNDGLWTIVDLLDFKLASHLWPVTAKYGDFSYSYTANNDSDSGPA